MKIRFDILRRKDPESRPYLQSIDYEAASPEETVATALTAFGEEGKFTDTAGNTVEPVRWECSCLQKKCGACAMVINGKPRLACDTFLFEEGKKGRIRLEPLGKFPVVADLIVDRSILFENLKTLQVWSDETVRTDEDNTDSAYEASRCLQCGCCLEVCPNFCAGGSFAGTASFVPQARLLVSLSGAERERVRKSYRKHIYEGCGKSLACRNICPAGINIEQLLIRSNALAIWERVRK